MKNVLRSWLMLVLTFSLVIGMTACQKHETPDPESPTFYVKTDGSQEAQKVYAEAAEYMEKEYYEKVVELLREVWDSDAGYLEAAIMLGDAYYALGEKEEADDVWGISESFSSDSEDEAYWTKEFEWRLGYRSCVIRTDLPNGYTEREYDAVGNVLWEVKEDTALGDKSVRHWEYDENRNIIHELEDYTYTGGSGSRHIEIFYSDYVDVFDAETGTMMSKPQRVEEKGSFNDDPTITEWEVTEYDYDSGYRTVTDYDPNGYCEESNRYDALNRNVRRVLYLEGNDRISKEYDLVYSDEVDEYDQYVIVERTETCYYDNGVKRWWWKVNGTSDAVWEHYRIDDGTLESRDVYSGGIETTQLYYEDVQVFSAGKKETTYYDNEGNIIKVE